MSVPRSRASMRSRCSGASMGSTPSTCWRKYRCGHRAQLSSAVADSGRSRPGTPGPASPTSPSNLVSAGAAPAGEHRCAPGQHQVIDGQAIVCGSVADQQRQVVLGAVSPQDRRPWRRRTMRRGRHRAGRRRRTPGCRSVGRPGRRGCRGATGSACGPRPGGGHPEDTAGAPSRLGSGQHGQVVQMLAVGAIGAGGQIGSDMTLAIGKQRVVSPHGREGAFGHPEHPDMTQSVPRPPTPVVRPVVPTRSIRHDPLRCRVRVRATAGTRRWSDRDRPHRDCRVARARPRCGRGRAARVRASGRARRGDRRGDRPPTSRAVTSSSLRRRHRGGRRAAR